MNTHRALAALLAAGLAGASHANLIVNGDFESAVGPPFGAGDAWTFFSENIDWDCGRAHGGQCSLMLSTDPRGILPDILSQDFATVPGQTYRLGFWAQTPAYLPFPDGAGTFAVPEGLVHSNPPYPAATTFQTGYAWQRYEYDFVASDASARLSFKGLGFAHDRVGNYINVDDVAVTAVVPEPGTGAMLLAGLAVTLLPRRLRSARAAAAAPSPSRAARCAR